jgi:hypothetical protein
MYALGTLALTWYGLEKTVSEDEISPPDKLVKLLEKQNTLLTHHMQLSENRHVDVLSRFSTMEDTMRHQADQISELFDRVRKNESRSEKHEDKIRQAFHSHSELEGAVLAEVGKLASNDADQRKALSDLQEKSSELHAMNERQTDNLGQLLEESKTRKVQVDLVLKIAKLVPVMGAGAIAILSGIMWLIAHAK